MPLPSPAEYDDAVQNPQFAFLDAELRNSVNDGPLRAGLPGPVASGNNAIVYRFRNNEKRFAVKCFTREKTDQHARYQSIHEYLDARRLPWTVDFQFLQAGIRIRGLQYPIVKMQWLHDAVTLQTYLSKSIKTAKPLEEVRDQFYQMVTDLHRNTIAHGDLQHGNLILSDGRLRIIDYDGMCVPSTQGLKSDEDGLPDFQHPARKGGTLQPHFDNFAALVIWTSLHALTINPLLWERYVGQDERLLFRKQDFLTPDQSGLMRELASYGEPRLKRAVTALASAASETVLSKIPHLTDIIEPDVSGGNSSVPWWKDSLPKANGGGPRSPAPGVLPAWIADSQTPQTPPERFRSRPYFLSAVTAVGIGVVLVVSVMGLGAALPPLVALTEAGAAAVSVALLLYLGFRATRERRKLSKIESKVGEASAAVDHCQRELIEWQAPHLERISKIRAQFSGDEAKLISMASEVAKRKEEIDYELLAALRSLTTERTAIDRERVAAGRLASQSRDAAKSSYQAKVNAADAEVTAGEGKYRSDLQQLVTKLGQERQNRLKAKIDAFVETELQKIDIGRTTVSGINYTAIQTFRGYGINTPADFTSYALDGSLKTKTGRWVKVKNVGHARARDLVNWRLRMMRNAEDKIPAAEKRSITLLVDEEERREKMRLGSVLDSTKQRVDAQKLALKRDFDKSISDINAGEAQALQLAKNRGIQVDAREHSARTTARNRETNELAVLNRELWALQSVVDPARHRLKMETQRLADESKSLMDALELAKRMLAAATHERVRFGQITFSKYCRFVLSD